MPFARRGYLDALADHVVIFDGATGTQLAKFSPAPADFGSERAQGLWEMLLFYRPELVTQVHEAYLAAGAEVIKTNTFRANPINLIEFGVAERSDEITATAAKLARDAADRHAQKVGAPRFVAGSVGPSGKLPSMDDPQLSDVSFAELVEVYAHYARGLVAAGVDLILLETHQDLLELKAAIHGVWRVFEELDARIPIQAQVTLEPNGHMLSGPDIEAALVTLAALPVDVIGMNCSTGPYEMRDSVRRLLALSRHPVSVMPNAGMPENVDGQAHYAMLPQPFAEAQAEFVRQGVRAVGGCCGTGPEHTAALVAAVRALPSQPQTYDPGALPYVAGNIHAVALNQEPRPLLVGERINTQGSRQARDLVLELRYDALAALGQTQVDYGAHVLDICVALTERGDEAATMRRVAKLLTLNTPAPLVADTTSLDVMRAALETSPGRAIINSVNLEAGVEHAREVMALARDFGAALVALTIDEQGMAKSVERKLDVARRLYTLAVDEVGLPPHALIFDPLTFTLATGDPESADAAVATLEALRRIKAELPGALTNLGVSNVSFGLKPAARRVLNSAFLYRAVEAGLDMAIVNPAQITPYPDIPADLCALAEALLFNREPEALARFVARFEGAAAKEEATQRRDLPPEQALFDAVLHRRREGVEALVAACLVSQSPVEVLNTILFPAMKEVGDRFGEGKLILPFVLQSAEVMKAAVACVETHFDAGAGVSKGTLVLATVFGDVHDIGKNLVKTILVNNGYTVHDLGRQVPVEAIVDKAVEVHADAIGLSALLVATSQQMQRCVAELHRRDLAIPLLVGGAAINERFAQRIAILENGDLYPGGVYHCKDAFEGLQVLEHVILHQPDVRAHSHAHAEPAPEAVAESTRKRAARASRSACATCALPTPPTPPFWGARCIETIPLDELEPLLDRKALFRLGWGARGTTGAPWEELRPQFEERLAAMWPEVGTYLAPQAAYGYFPVHSQRNDLLFYDPRDPDAGAVVARLDFPRQFGNAGQCLADYFSGVECAAPDVTGLQVVTVGPGASARIAALNDAGDFSEAYFVHGLAAQVVEAAAEWVHCRIRRELGLAAGQGKRYSWGYPICPDLNAHRVVLRLLFAGEHLGMTLSPAAQLIPEHSTAALVVPHPKAAYFSMR
ncbi:MAG: homocysteine S-methyltransferase family protein [Anaerolineae bacterium]|nr:homocysteine S-methyltransferase family protein [Anaerolineae bacterium]